MVFSPLYGRMESEFTFIDLFAGVGGIRIPFDELGGKCVFSSEIEPNASKMYEANFNEKPYGDITQIASDNIPNHDILLAGFPCQPFSIIGKGFGFADTRGTLFFEIERILKDKAPKAFLLENVRRLTTHDKGRTLKVILSKLEALGYFPHWKVLNALDYGLPQKRERVIIVGFDDNYPFMFPKTIKERISLKDIIEDHDTIDKKFFASKRITEKRKKTVAGKYIPVPSIWHENKSGNIGIHEYSCALRAGASYNYLLVDGIRRMTPRELFSLQGFPKDFKIVVSDSKATMLAGNSVPVNMIRAVAVKMLESMKSEPLPCNMKICANSGQLTLQEV